MPLTNLNTIEAEMGAIANFIDDITDKQIAKVVRIQLKQRAFKLLYQQKQNVVSRHYNATVNEWLIRHGYNAGEELEITLQMKVALYLQEFPGTVLDGVELEEAAQQMWIAEMNSIDAEINTEMQTMVKPTLGDSFAFVENMRQNVEGFETKIDNLLKAAIVASLKE